MGRASEYFELLFERLNARALGRCGALGLFGWSGWLGVAVLASWLACFGRCFCSLGAFCLRRYGIGGDCVEWCRKCVDWYERVGGYGVGGYGIGLQRGVDDVSLCIEYAVGSAEHAEFGASVEGMAGVLEGRWERVDELRRQDVAGVQEGIAFCEFGCYDFGSCFAVAFCYYAFLGNAVRGEVVDDGLCASLAECEVVFFGATVVAVRREFDLYGAVGA